MFVIGMTGLIAGAVINLHEKMRSPLAMAAVSGVCTFTVYGLLVDIWTAFGFYARPTPESVLAVYAAAVALNAIFAVSTGIFVFFFGEPVIKKIDRVKLKYGIFYSRI